MVSLPGSSFHSLINIFNSHSRSRFDLNASNVLFMLFLLTVSLLQLLPAAHLALCSVSCLCWCFCAIPDSASLASPPTTSVWYCSSLPPLHLIPISLLTLLFQLLEKNVCNLAKGKESAHRKSFSILWHLYRGMHLHKVFCSPIFFFLLSASLCIMIFEVIAYVLGKQEP